MYNFKRIIITVIVDNLSFAGIFRTFYILAYNFLAKNSMFFFQIFEKYFANFDDYFLIFH